MFKKLLLVRGETFKEGGGVVMIIGSALLLLVAAVRLEELSLGTLILLVALALWCSVIGVGVGIIETLKSKEKHEES